MDNAGVRNGVFMGIALIIITIIMYLFDAMFMLEYSFYISFFVYILFVVKAGLDERENLGGYANFKEILKPTFLAFTIGTLMATLFSYVLMNFIDPSLLDLIMDKSVEMTEAMEGWIGEDAVEEELEKLEERGVGGLGMTMFSYCIMLILGFVISLICAAFIKKDKPFVA